MKIMARPRVPHNVEQSIYKPGEWVAYDAHGHVWRINKDGKEWRAVPAANNPARMVGATIIKRTLAEVAHAVDMRGKPTSTPVPVAQTNE